MRARWLRLLALPAFALAPLLLAVAAPGEAWAGPLKVVTTITDFAQIAQEIGGDAVQTVALTKPTQDPHFVDARPSFVVDLSQADLLVYAGAELEVGWLPPLLRASSNPRILPGAPGHLNVATVVPMMEVPPATVDRSTGDNHPLGNPHTWTDPRNGLRIAIAITQRLKALDAAHGPLFESNLKAFARKLGTGMRTWKARMAPWRGTKVLVYHKGWTYLLDWLGFEQLGTVEPLPGIPPADSDLVALVGKHAKSGAVALVLGESFCPPDRMRFVAEGVGAKALLLPAMSGGPEAKTYVELMGFLVEQIGSSLEARKPRG